MLNLHPGWLHHRHDLEQEALLAAVSAIPLFDSRRGVKFETFAWYRLRKAVQQYVRQMLGPVASWESKHCAVEAVQLIAADAPDQQVEKAQAHRVAHAYSAAIVRAARQRAWRSDSGGAQRDIAIFELVELQGVSQADVARRLGISRQRVNAVLKHAQRIPRGPARRRSPGATAKKSTASPKSR